jgi:hypothetical protein
MPCVHDMRRIFKPTSKQSEKDLGKRQEKRYNRRTTDDKLISARTVTAAADDSMKGTKSLPSQSIFIGAPTQKCDAIKGRQKDALHFLYYLYSQTLRRHLENQAQQKLLLL